MGDAWTLNAFWGEKCVLGFFPPPPGLEEGVDTAREGEQVAMPAGMESTNTSEYSLPKASHLDEVAAVGAVDVVAV